MASTAPPAFVAVLLRDNEGAEEYVQRVSDRGGVAIVVPVLSTEAVNRDLLVEALKNLDSFSGLICTSQRAATTINETISSDHLTVPDSYPCYVVGIKSAAALRTHPFTFKGVDSRNAEELASVILAEPSLSKPLLFLRGDKTLDVITKALRAREISLEERTIYVTSTCSTDRLCAGISQGLEALGPEVADKTVPFIVLCCSPSAVTILTEAMLTPVFSASRWASRHLIALGNSTAGRLKEAGMDAVICDFPTPEGFNHALDKIVHSLCSSA